MELTSKNVQEVFLDCLFREEETDRTNYVVGEGVIHRFGFHPERLASHKDDIKTMLDQLPEQFQLDKGGGWSFLNACDRKDGVQWGEHPNIEQLMALGLASKQATLLMPRELWRAMPGGMPYFVVGGVASSQEIDASQSKDAKIDQG